MTVSVYTGWVRSGGEDWFVCDSCGYSVCGTTEPLYSCASCGCRVWRAANSDEFVSLEMFSTNMSRASQWTSNGHMTAITAALKGEGTSDQRRIAEVGLEWINLILRKNHDYGSSVWQVPILCPGMSTRTAILVRMSDKIQRLQNLLRDGAENDVDESIDDTIRDLSAYGLLLLADPSK